MRFAKLFLAFGVPALAVIALTFHASQDMSAMEMPLAFAINLPFIAAPQVAFFIIGTIVGFRAPVVLGGMLALDIWLICFEWLLFHSTSRDSTGWLIYWIGCVPVGLFGAFAGWVFTRWRASLRDGTMV
jgi:hypothetical protein